MKHDPNFHQPVLYGDKVCLRPLSAGDAPLVAKYANDRRIAEMTTSIPFPLSLEAAQEFCAQAENPERLDDVWAIDGRPDGARALHGVISLRYLDREQSEVGYWVAPAFWNQGYASAALQVLLAANPHGNASVVASVFQDNPASAKVLSGAGFALLGEAEAFSLARAAHVPTWTYLKALPGA